MSAIGVQPVPATPIALRAGDEMPETTFGPVTRTHIVRHAGAGGDFHPLHHDELYAQASGAPTVFAMGLMQAGMLGNRLARWVGPNNVRTFAVRFTGQVWPGDELTFSGRIEGVATVGGEPRAQLVLAVTNQSGDSVVTATATAAVAPEEAR